MKKNNIILAALALALAAPGFSQNDTIDRSVTIERELQPTVKASDKLSAKPAEFTPVIKQQPVVYSSYSEILNTEFNLAQLGASETGFARPKEMHGFLRAGIGHSNTLFDFSYRVDQHNVGSSASAAPVKRKKNNEGFLDISAHHLGQWGRKTLEETEIAIDYEHEFSKTQLYFGIEGGSEYFYRYNLYIDPSTGQFTPKWPDIEKEHKEANWMAGAFVGLCNAPGEDFKWNIRTGYDGYYMPEYLGEHQIHTLGSFEWERDGRQHVGLDFDLQNRLYSVHEPVDSIYAHAKHTLHLQPFYAFTGQRFRVHAGVNLDMAFGGYRRAFGASPNVRLEGDITKDWLSVYLDARGRLEAPGYREELEANRFLDTRLLMQSMTDSCCSAYTPIDLEGGFIFRPHTSLLIGVHGGFAYLLNEHVYAYDVNLRKFSHIEQDQQIGKVGAVIHYHYKDIFSMNLSGDYFFAKGRELTPISHCMEAAQGEFTSSTFGKPSWQVRARFDGRINSRWSLYSDNYFAGGRTALLLDQSTLSFSQADLKPILDLNLGVEYNINKWLSVFAQLNNYLAWTSSLTYELFYSTPAQGVNCLFGVSWTF